MFSLDFKLTLKVVLISARSDHSKVIFPRYKGVNNIFINLNLVYYSVAPNFVSTDYVRSLRRFLKKPSAHLQTLKNLWN